MENLDELMRKKFDSDDPAGRFEFREEFWEQAQVLIEADEARRRKRRRWLIWWLFFGLCIAIGGWWGRGSWNSNSLDDAKISLDNSSNKRGDSLGTDHGAGSPGGNGNNETTGDKVVNEAVAGSGATPGTNSGAGAGVRDWDAKNKGKAGSNDNNNSALQNKDNPGNTAGAAAGRPAGTQKRSATRAGGKGQNRNPAHVAGLQPGAVVAGNADGKQPPNDSNNPSGNKRTDSGVHQAGGNADTAQPNAGDGPALARPDSIAAGLPARNEWKSLVVFPALPVGPGYLELPKRTVDTQTVDAFVKIIIPRRESKFRFGLSATGTLSQASPDGKRLGFTGGALVHYNLTQTWSIASGLHWRYLSGAWARDSAATGSEQLKYSFGYKLDTWHLETQGLHLVEVPIGLRWKQGAFALEGGFTPGFVVAVQGQLTKGHMESLQDGFTTKTSKVWLEKNVYHAFVPSFFLGGEWLATRRIGLTLRAALRPGEVGPKLTDTPPPANLFWLDAGLRWYF